MKGRDAALACAALVAIAAGAMVLAGANPVDGFVALLRGALGGPRQLFETLVATTSLLFPALAVALAFRAGLFNIGAEGQLIVGGLAAGVLGTRLDAPGALAIPAILLAGALGGGVWGAIAGVIRARFGGSEVIATLMLNIVAALLANYLLVGPLHAPGAEGAETGELSAAAWLPTLVAGTRLTVALPLGLALAALLALVLSRTVFGYTLRAAGEAPQAALRAGIDLRRTALVAMALSGALAGSAAPPSSRAFCTASTSLCRRATDSSRSRSRSSQGSIRYASSSPHSRSGCCKAEALECSRSRTFPKT